MTSKCKNTYLWVWQCGQLVDEPLTGLWSPHFAWLRLRPYAALPSFFFLRAVDFETFHLQLMWQRIPSKLIILSSPQMQTIVCYVRVANDVNQCT